MKIGGLPPVLMKERCVHVGVCTCVEGCSVKPRKTKQAKRKSRDWGDIQKTGPLE